MSDSGAARQLDKHEQIRKAMWWNKPQVIPALNLSLSMSAAQHRIQAVVTPSPKLHGPMQWPSPEPLDEFRIALLMSTAGVTKAAAPSSMLLFSGAAADLSAAAAAGSSTPALGGGTEAEDIAS